VRPFFLPFAQQTAGASRRPAFPAPSWTKKAKETAKLGRTAPRERDGVSANDKVIDATARHTIGVIARLDRAIQYSETAVIDWMGRGVLDFRFRGKRQR
jgi:hypothetical protein